MTRFAKVGSTLFNIAEVKCVEFDEDMLKATVTLTKGEMLFASGVEVIELAYLLKPSFIEGRKMKHVRHSWIVHNMLGHPVMQILAIFKLYKAAIWVHDITTPKVDYAERSE